MKKCVLPGAADHDKTCLIIFLSLGYLACTKGLNSSNTELIFNISALGGSPCNLVVDCMNKIVPKVPESDYYETLYFDFSNLVKMQTKCLLLCCFFFFP